MSSDLRALPVVSVMRSTPARAWITAPRPLHHHLIRAAQDGAAAHLLMTGHKLERDVTGRALSEALGEVGGTIESRLADNGVLIVVEPHWMDHVSKLAVAEAFRAQLGVVVITSSLEEDDLLEFIDPDARRRQPWIDDDGLERWATDALGRSLPDATIHDLYSVTGGDAHLIGLLLEGMARAEVRLPGSADVAGARVALGAFVTAALEAVGERMTDEIESAAVSGLGVSRDGRAEAYAAGLTDADGGLAPVIRELVTDRLPEHRRHELAGELAARADLDATQLTTALVRLGRVPPPAAPTVVETARAWLTEHPDRALEAVELVPSSTDADLVRMHALALLGRMRDAAAVADSLLASGPSPYAALVTAAGLAAAARFAVAAGAYAGADPDDQLRIGATRLAMPALATIGRTGSVYESSSASVTSAAIARLAEGSLALLADTDEALAALVDGAELAASVDATLWPDTPHTLAAIASTLAFDHDRASRILDHAIEHDVGGAAHRARHRALAGWVAIRSGRWSDADDTITGLAGRSLSLRDRLALSGLRIAVARRAGEIAGIESEVEDAVGLVLRHPVDLVSLPAHTEIAIALARLGAHERANSMLDQIEEFTSHMPALPWRAHAAWTRIVAGLLSGTEGWLTADPTELVGSPVAPAALAASKTAAGPVDEMVDICEGLVELGQIHEAAVLAAAAALDRPTSEARPLVTLATSLRGRLPGRGREAATGLEALSDREMEVARELIDGRRYKEIGERLYISAKTVEHHVAHIKTKLGASSRSEMISTLRNALG